MMRPAKRAVGALGRVPACRLAAFVVCIGWLGLGWPGVASAVPAAANDLRPYSRSRASIAAIDTTRIAVTDRGSDATLSDGPCPPRCSWESFIHYSYASVSEGRAAWHHAQVNLVHDIGDRFTAALEVIESSRFGRWDRAAAVDGYAELWPQSYANVRTQLAPSAQFMPAAEGYAEVFQGLPRGWETSAAYRLRSFPDDRIHIFGMSLGRYVGRWYVRAIGQMMPREGEVGLVYSARARRFIEPPRAFFEVEVGRGRGVEVIDVGPIVQMTRTYHASLKLQTYLTRHFGVSIQGIYSDDHFFERRSVALGLMSRW